jgi:D-alanyl-D-alanine carboxypeptidase
MLESHAQSAHIRPSSILAALALVVVTVLSLAGCGTSPAPVESSPDPPGIRAWSGIVMERRSGSVLWSKAPDRELPPASTIKIMTALLTLERVRDLEEWMTVPRIPLPQTVGVDLQPGDRITVRQALYALLLESANDAALTLATHVAGSEPEFVVLMNRRARQLGMTHTHFTNARGTAEPGLHSSARDLATLARRALREAAFRRIVTTREAVIEYPPDAAIRVHNHNRLLRYDWADGVKTGSNDASGKVLVGSGDRGGVALIVVTMHQRTRDEEVEDAVKLFRWSTDEYLRRSAASTATAASPEP